MAQSGFQEATAKSIATSNTIGQATTIVDIAATTPMDPSRSMILTSVGPTSNNGWPLHSA
jgi:hypothetical protein